MGRNQGKGKGKEPAFTSGARRNKRRNLRLEDEVEEEEEQIPKPSWDKKVPLSSFHEVWQPELYMDKLSSLKSIENVLVCERAVAMPEFRAIGVADCFDRLGWEAALTFRGDGSDRVYTNGIVEWMSTLRKIEGPNPPRTMRLVGTVYGREVIMSFDTIRAVAPFDSRLARDYVYPETNYILTDESAGPAWISMLQDIFRPERGVMTRTCMRALPKLIHLIMGHNVIPRHGDKMKVRHYEIRVLHALLTGSPVFSFRHLALLNVWESRESKDRKMIPHCRLLSALMRMQGVVDDDSQYIVKPHKSFTLSRLSNTDWHYVKTRRHHVLRDIKGREVLRGLRADAPPLMPGESEEEGLDMGQGEGEDEDENPTETEREEEGPSASRGARGMTSTSGMWFEDDLMEGIVRSRRPVEHQSWPQISQMNWDRWSQDEELARRRHQQVMEREERHHQQMMEREDRHHQEMMERQELYARSQALSFEQDVNNRYNYDEQVRH